MVEGCLWGHCTPFLRLAALKSEVGGWEEMLGTIKASATFWLSLGRWIGEGEVEGKDIH